MEKRCTPVEEKLVEISVELQKTLHHNKEESEMIKLIAYWNVRLGKDENKVNLFIRK